MFDTILISDSPKPYFMTTGLIICIDVSNFDLIHFCPICLLPNYNLSQFV